MFKIRFAYRLMWDWHSCAASLLHAQGNNASVTGIIRDPSEAAISGSQTLADRCKLKAKLDLQINSANT